MPERGARLARRDDREYREYLREKQRSQPGCIAVRMQMELHHGLSKLARHPASPIAEATSRHGDPLDLNQKIWPAE